MITKALRATAALLAVIVLSMVLAPGPAFADDDDRKGLAFRAELSGAQEVPEVVTDTSGRITLRFDSALSEARFKLRVFDGVDVQQAHFHCARPGANGPVVAFLFGFVAGGVDVDGTLAKDTLTNADFIGADCVPAIGRPVNNIASLAFAARDGLIYTNVHSVLNPSGEVRGQLLER